MYTNQCSPNQHVDYSGSDIQNNGNCRLRAKAFTSVPGTRSQRRQRIRQTDNVKEDLHQRGSDIQQAAECVKD